MTTDMNAELVLDGNAVGGLLSEIFGEDLTGQKARIKLMLALGLTDDVSKIRDMFEYLV